MKHLRGELKSWVASFSRSGTWAIRLENRLSYGPEYGLHIEGNSFGGLTVQMKLKKLRVEDYEEQKREG